MKLSYDVRNADRGRKIRKPRNIQSKIAAFGSSLLVGGLLLCSQPAAAQSQRPQDRTEVKRTTKARASPAKRLLREGKETLDEAGKATVEFLKAVKKLQGQEFSFHLTGRAMHSLTIKSVSKDSVTADIRLSMISGFPTVNLISMTIQFNDVVLAEHLVKELAASAEAKTGKKQKSGTVDLSDRWLLRAVLFGGVQQETPQYMFDREYMARMLSGMLFLSDKLRDKSIVRPKPDVGFRIKSENEKEIVFKITKGRYKGKTIKLDRKMDINIEFLAEKAGFFTMPARLENMTGDKAKPYLVPKLDCSRDIHMEIFMSEHSGGRHPACAVETTTVRKGDSIRTLGKVTAIDSKGVVFNEAGRLDYGKERRVGEFLVTTTLRADKGTEPGTAKITKIGTEFGQSE